MSVLDELYPASFRGVPFLARSSSVSGGRKVVVHEYPNTDRRYVEDLGKQERVFSITGITSAPYYLENRNALQYALEQPGIGILVHPFFGVVNVTADPYTLTEDDTALGIATFSMTFRVSDENIFPAYVEKSLDLINDLTDGAASKVISEITTGFSVSSGYPNNFTEALSNLGDITTSFSDLTNSVNASEDAKNDYNAKISAFAENKVSNIKSPTDLGSNLVDLFDAANDLGTTDTEKFNINKHFFEYLLDETQLNPLTPQRIERRKNTELLSSAMNIASLSYAYKSAVAKTYVTDQDIGLVAKSLEDQYQYFVSNNDFSTDAMDALNSLRSEVRRFFKDEKLNVYNITTITTKEIPLTVLAYNYYGNVNNTEDLMFFNEILDPSHVVGDLDVFTGGSTQ
jgi:prophage DNA circulation protein